MHHKIHRKFDRICSIFQRGNLSTDKRRNFEKSLFTNQFLTLFQHSLHYIEWISAGIKQLGRRSFCIPRPAICKLITVQLVCKYPCWMRVSGLNSLKILKVASRRLQVAAALSKRSPLIFDLFYSDMSYMIKQAWTSQAFG